MDTTTLLVIILVVLLGGGDSSTDVGSDSQALVSDEQWAILREQRRGETRRWHTALQRARDAVGMPSSPPLLGACFASRRLALALARDPARVDRDGRNRGEILVDGAQIVI